MPTKITIETETFGDAMNLIHRMAGAGPRLVLAPTATAEMPVAETVGFPAATPAEEKPRKPRKTAEPKTEPVATPPVEPEPEQPAAEEVELEQVPSVDDVRTAVRDVAIALGTPAAQALVNQYGAKGVSDVQPEDRAKFIAEAAALVAKAKK